MFNLNKYFFIFILIASTSAQSRSKQVMSSLMAANGACFELDTSWTPQYASLFGYWNLNGTIQSLAAGTTIPATIGNSGTTFGSTARTAAKLNQGMTFTSDSAIDTGNSAAFTGLTQISVAVWAYFPSGWDHSSWNIMFEKYVSSSHTAVIQANGAGSGVMTFCVSAASVPCVIIADFTAVTAGWHHIVGTYDGANVKTYLDGTLKNTTALTGGITTNSASFAIGGRTGVTGQSLSFRGTIDEIALWNKALTLPEIKTLYSQQSCGSN